VTQALSKPTKAAFHAPSLDGIRAASFLLVFAAHAGLERIVPGGFGVTVFFFLSGYLITTLLRIEHDRRGTISLRQFYLRRALRILPPFYVVLGGAVLATLVGLLPGVVTARAVTAQLLHCSNYWVVGHGYEGQPSGTGVYWSLAVEEHFYLLFPAFLLLLFRFVRQRSGQAIALFAACALVLAWRCVLVFWMHAATDRTYVATDTRVDSILFGCALAAWHNPMLDAPGRVPELVWKWVLLPVATLVLLFTFLRRDAPFRETFRYSLQGLALVPFFVVAMRWPAWGPFVVLNLAR
jgi:peptidoglycan/LPS O-acetylase OafA/YrhL